MDRDQHPMLYLSKVAITNKTYRDHFNDQPPEMIQIHVTRKTTQWVVMGMRPSMTAGNKSRLQGSQQKS